MGVVLKFPRPKLKRRDPARKRLKATWLGYAPLPKYDGPDWIGKQLTLAPLPIGPEWIGKAA